VLIAGFPAGTFGTNCYVVANAPGEPCLIVDPGQDSIDGVLEIVSENRLAPAAVLLTHGHIDHIWCVAPMTAIGSRTPLATPCSPRARSCSA
jgi:glyoxylase-like metal-dependent hydrolase (beta-lactamase superfamily II)